MSPPPIPIRSTITLLVVVGRGASDPDANSNVAKVMRMLWEGFGFGWGETCYSGVTFPLVEPGLEHAARLGYKRIVVFPYFLFTGILVQRIYDYTDVVAARHPEIEFVKAGYLNDHPAVLDAFAKAGRVHEAVLAPDQALREALELELRCGLLRRLLRSESAQPSPDHVCFRQTTLGRNRFQEVDILLSKAKRLQLGR